MERFRHRLAKGFSLIELLVVTAIILIILAVAIPNIQKFRKKFSANDSSGIVVLA